MGLDCSNGSTFNIAKSVFDALGAKTYVVGNEPDGTNINMGCGSTHIGNLQRLSGRRSGLPIHLTEMRIGVLPWMRTVWNAAGVISCMSGKYLKECGPCAE